MGANGRCDHPRNAAGLTYRSLHPSRDKYSRTGFLLPCRQVAGNPLAVSSPVDGDGLLAPTPFIWPIMMPARR